MSNKSKKQRARGRSVVDGAKVQTKAVRKIVGLIVSGDEFERIILDDGSTLDGVAGLRTMEHTTGQTIIDMRVMVDKLEVRNVGNKPIPPATPITRPPPPGQKAPEEQSLILTPENTRPRNVKLTDHLGRPLA